MKIMKKDEEGKKNVRCMLDFCLHVRMVIGFIFCILWSSVFNSCMLVGTYHSIQN